KQVSKEEGEKLEEYRKKLIESAAETDDALIEKYLANEKLSKEEIKKGLREGLVKNNFIPLFCGSALKNMGIDSLLNTIIDFFPSPLLRKSVKGKLRDKETERKISAEEPLSALVFQTLAEAHLGEVNLFKVYSGNLSSGSTVYNSVKNKEEKIGQIYLMQGNKREEVPQILAGDIGAVTKLKNTDTGDTLCQKEVPIKFSPPEIPELTTSIAIRTQEEKDEQKLSVALARLIKVAPLLKMEIDKEFGQTVLSGTGKMHLQIAIERLKDEFGIDVKTEEPKIHYRETITAVAESQGRYKRQTGGHGQYGDVWLRIKPLPRGEGIKFVNEIRGGAVPTRFIPSVEKGVKEAVRKGFLASYPLVDVEVTLFDGSYHPVDSSDIAFQIAASIGLKKAVEKGKPILLEPIMEIEVEIPDEFLGETNGDLNSRRGRIMEVESFKNRKKIKAHVPAAELHDYSTRLRSITQGRGAFRKKFSHYERAPEGITQKAIAQAQADKESK
ncbi:MAG: elongation factor G, partial [Candidatus Aerophobetes bacterium]|nr:elongation factor G [Candidatus Aerophobetes bacterium]